ncbi:MAG: hypothetical protein ACRDQA_09920, partial [Nocardioidaceae bacterium]
CMSMTRRLQLLLDEERYQRVATVAKVQRISVAAVIRDAIDHSLAPVDRHRDAAAKSILSAAPMEVPAGNGLLDELHGLRERR